MTILCAGQQCGGEAGVDKECERGDPGPHDPPEGGTEGAAPPAKGPRPQQASEEVCTHYKHTLVSLTWPTTHMSMRWWWAVSM